MARVAAAAFLILNFRYWGKPQTFNRETLRYRNRRSKAAATTPCLLLFHILSRRNSKQLELLPDDFLVEWLHHKFIGAGL